MPPCWRNLHAELEHYEGRNLIISEEGFGTHWLKPDLWSNTSSTGDQFSVMRNLARALGNRWEIVVIVAYRRLYEWLPSAKQQLERWHRKKKALYQWPGRNGGRSLEPLFPNYVLKHPCVDPTSKRSIVGYRYTSDILDYFLRHNVSTKILNYHSDSKIQEQFFCEMIPNAPRSCTRARQLPIEEVVLVNAGRSDPVNYDRLVTHAAVVQGWIDMERFTRHEVVLAAQQYMERQQSGTLSMPNNNTMTMQCPSKRQLQVLLGASLRMEASIFEHVAAVDNTTAAAFVLEEKQQHQAAFWRAAAKHKFCSVDPAAELQKETWRNFFASFH